MTRTSESQPPEPRLDYAGPEAERLLAGYDRASGDWAFPRTGPFWEAVALAHAAGLRGAGRRIAILDSAFDLTIPALAANATLCLPNRPGADLSHGTVVALLVNSIAPDAALDLYAIGGPDGPDRHAMRAALRKVADSEAGLLCISLGVAVPLAGLTLELKPLFPLVAMRPRQCPLPSGCLCEAVEAAAPGRTIFAAVGNDDGSLFCPAMAPSAAAIGFQLERRMLDAAHGESAWATPPAGYKQSDAADYTLIQPDGVLGSSFATPLVAGAAALQPDPDVIATMQQACLLGALADMQLADYRTAAPRDPALLSAALGYYREALAAFPHRAALAGGAHWCIGCALYGGTLFVNAGLAHLEAANLTNAEALLRIARAIAPLSADAAANLATTLLMRATDAADATARAPDAKDLVREAIALFDIAIALRPHYSGYDSARTQAVSQLPA